MQRVGGIPEAGLCSGPDRTITNENVSYAFVQPLGEMARPHIGQLQNIYVLLIWTFVDATKQRSKVNMSSLFRLLGHRNEEFVCLLCGSS